MLKLEMMRKYKEKASSTSWIIFSIPWKKSPTSKNSTNYIHCVAETSVCPLIFIILSCHSDGIPNFYLGLGSPE